MIAGCTHHMDSEVRVYWCEALNRVMLPILVLKPGPSTILVSLVRPCLKKTLLYRCVSLLLG